MKSVFKSQTIWGIIALFAPAVGVAVSNPTPENIAAALVQVVGFVSALRGRFRIGDLKL